MKKPDRKTVGYLVVGGLIAADLITAFILSAQNAKNPMPSIKRTYYQAKEKVLVAKEGISRRFDGLSEEHNRLIDFLEMENSLAGRRGQTKIVDIQSIKDLGNNLFSFSYMDGTAATMNVAIKDEEVIENGKKRLQERTEYSMPKPLTPASQPLPDGPAPR